MDATLLHTWRSFVGDKVVNVLTDFGLERVRQNKKWGEQHHPDGTGRIYKLRAEEAKERCAAKAKNGTLTWTDILWEEFFEALTEVDLDKLRAEQVQVGAVAAAWVEDIDHRTALLNQGISPLGEGYTVGRGVNE